VNALLVIYMCIGAINTILVVTLLVMESRAESGTDITEVVALCVLSWFPITCPFMFVYFTIRSLSTFDNVGSNDTKPNMIKTNKGFYVLVNDEYVEVTHEEMEVQQNANKKL